MQSPLRVGSHLLPIMLIWYTGSVGAREPQPPSIVAAAPITRPILLSDASLRCFRTDGASQCLVSVSSTDGGRTWSEPQRECPLPQPAMGGGIAAVDRDGELHVVLMHGRGEGQPAVTRFIDLWHCRTKDKGQQWTQPQRIWQGYCGSVNDVKVLSSGRIIVPFAAWKEAGNDVAPATGSNYTTCVYSDDGGQNWKLSTSKLTAPCIEGYNGNNYGAIEPTILELKDGRVWMLMRTQAGTLYESFSTDGSLWSVTQPTSFRTSTSPAALERLPDGRIILFFNHCEMPPRHAGAGVYGGRDALHAAISADEGRTWQGFREVYRDPFRNETPPRRGDRGTAYPLAVATKDGTVVLVSGQGNRRRMILIDPQWITATTQFDDFSKGLDAWHVWKEFGPAAGYWRDRTAGARLIDHPHRAGAKSLLINKPDEHDADCASWNFSATSKGTLTLRVMPREGFAGLNIVLNDRFFNPGDSRGETESIFGLQIGSSGEIGGGTKLPPGQWSSLKFRWDLSKRECRVLIDDHLAHVLIPNRSVPHGITYVRLRSLANQVDLAGCLVESTSIEHF